MLGFENTGVNLRQDFVLHFVLRHRALLVVTWSELANRSHS